MGIQTVVSYRYASKHVQEKLDLQMQLAQEKLYFELYDAYDARTQMEAFMRHEMDNKEEWLRVTHKVLRRYPNFYTCFVAYPPYEMSNKDKWYGLTSYRSGDSILTMKFGDEHHDYFKREWYKGAIESKEKGYWSQPYRDEDFDEPIFTYSDDLRDEKGRLQCVIGLDFSVKWLQELLEQFKPFEEAELGLYNMDGELITGSDEGAQVDGDGWVVSTTTLDPLSIKMVMAVPRTYIWDGIWIGIVVPLVVFILGIVIVALLIRRMISDEHENARLGTEKEIMAHELRIAHDIQMGILKGEKLLARGERDEVEVNATLLPMKEVGGDLYDYRIEGDFLWFIIGDVSGKGVPAAMLMSATVNIFRAAGKHIHSPKELMEEMNAVLSENNPSLTFVTAFIGRLHLSSGELLYCNAGHCPPLVKEQRDDVPCTREIQIEPNIPLGYDGKYEFVEQGCMLGEGETLVLYTDGVTEARNAKREMLGKARWAEMVGNGAHLLDQVKAFIKHAEPTDDITLMTIRKVSAVRPLTLPVLNREENWPVLRLAIHEYGICIGIDKRTLKKLEVAAEEAVVNILHHSQATTIELALSHPTSAFCMQLSDDGIPFDPTGHIPQHDAVETRQVGGLGISLIRQIADEMRYERSDEKNHLTIIKNI